MCWAKEQKSIFHLVRIYPEDLGDRCLNYYNDFLKVRWTGKYIPLNLLPQQRH